MKGMKKVIAGVLVAGMIGAVGMQTVNAMENTDVVMNPIITSRNVSDIDRKSEIKLVAGVNEMTPIITSRTVIKDQVKTDITLTASVDIMNPIITSATVK
ncbi:hypothetical protein EXD82_09230 [Peptacetobacter hominis]|uniref:Uncharacterized protein n=1 Tax=Peptacetobacter hominis TaxID=2743610 RepID=A0A544QTE3_9FIRM|nr:hypothetical protein [Peptacetobacter hominis]TQQ83959.1 hypothetical protein EXD82_09230 [Peptacetobacter hominis]